jgi:hypothetical protein
MSRLLCRSLLLLVTVRLPTVRETAPDPNPDLLTFFLPDFRFNRSDPKIVARAKTVTTALFLSSLFMITRLLFQVRPGS